MEGAGVERALARVDLGAVQRNCTRLAAVLGEDVRLCAVVKANGYGHGAIECAQAAIEGGAAWLAVAAAHEAEELRRALPDVPILTMGALTADELEIALGASSEVAVWRSGFLDLVAERGAARDLIPRVHVKYDTGMGRLGERDPGAVRDLARRCAEDPRVELAGVWTHFATADEPASGYFEEQLRRFRELAVELKRRYPPVIVHAANSAATLREPRSHFDMVRCGIAVYGLDPFHDDPDERDLKPALELRSYVADVKRFERGASAGYGRRWRAPSETWVGVLPIGYGDGVRRALSDNAEVLVEGRRYPLVGTVSMDNVTIDLGPETDVQPGAEAVLIGSQGGERILAEDVARRIETINYEIACGISSRVPRLHVR